MGLTIHYDLKLKDRRVSVARQAIERLHAKAQELPFQHVGEIWDVKGPETDFDRVDDSEGKRWFLIQSGCYVEISPHNVQVNPKRIIGFCTLPGNGCEPANFGLCQYPATIEFQGKRYRTHRPGWTWGSFCKTQYAQEFLKCHHMVCLMLDHAKLCGLEVDVHDEGGFYEDRNPEKLGTTVKVWNLMIASFVGKVDQLTGGGLGVESPIRKSEEYQEQLRQN
jgi:hypothetical protein